MKETQHIIKKKKTTTVKGKHIKLTYVLIVNITKIACVAATIQFLIFM